MTRAEGSFTIKSWDEDAYQQLDGDAKLTRARVTFEITGDLAGEGHWDALMCYRQDGSAVYTGLQHTVVTVAGRSGSFVLRTDGVFEGGAARTSWEVIAGSGTGELAAVTGSGESISTGPPGGTYSLELEG
ncbi:MAG TPA: DUF3224 domain-containing protein [Streptosporangiaceae bacterium]|jgi:hypothetical protein